MNGYVADIEKLTEKNENFRQVLYTGYHLQLVLMSLNPGEDIGLETHTTRDQFFRIEAGQGAVLIDDVSYDVRDGDCVIVPAGAAHNLTNVGKISLRLYTLYGPPEHADRIVHKSKANANASEELFDGIATK